MLRFSAAALAVAFPLLACQTATGIPCFTVTYEQSVWAMVKSPVSDMVTGEVRGTMAVRQDGSFALVVRPSGGFAVRQQRGGTEPRTRLGLAGSNTIVRGPDPLPDSRLPPLFYVDGLFRRASGGDPGCKAALAAFGKPLERAGPSKMLGEPVVSWKLATAYGDATVSVAPGLDCQILRLEAVEYRYRYLPIRKEVFEAKTVKRGEPAAGLFAVPKGK